MVLVYVRVGMGLELGLQETGHWRHCVCWDGSGVRSGVCERLPVERAGGGVAGGGGRAGVCERLAWWEGGVVDLQHNDVNYTLYDQNEPRNDIDNTSCDRTRSHNDVDYTLCDHTQPHNAADKTL